MNFEEYQKKSRKTAIYPNKGNNFIYPVLGLVGRDHNGVFSEEQRQEIKKELGDVLWYIAQIATELGLSLDEIAVFNIKKLESRKKRNKLHGNGDNR